MNPYDFQRHDLDVLKRNNYRGLLNIQTGGGKTVQGVFSHLESGSDVTLIIAPDQTHASAWLPTLEKVGLEGRIVGNGNKQTKQALSDLALGFEGLYLCTPQFFTRTDVTSWSGDLLIVDEAHMLASPKGKGQRKLSGYVPKDGEPLAQRFDGRLALSGTSLRNRFDLAWSHSRMLWPELNRKGQISHDNFYAWQNDRQAWKEVYTGQKDAWGAPKKVRQYLGEIVPGKWIREAPCVITHFKRERCCGYHPQGFLPLDEPLVMHETIPLSTAQKKAVREMEQHMVTYLDDNPLVSDIPLTQAQRIRQFTLGVPTVAYDEDDKAEVSFDVNCQSPYLDWLLGFLEKNDEPVVVYTDSQKFAAVATARLNRAGIPTFEFSGATRGARDGMLREFGSRYRVVVGVISAIGTGTDGIQNVASTEVWLNRDTDETNNTQAEGRLDRMGARKQVLRIFLHDDLGLSEGRYSDQVTKRLALAQSLRRVA